MEWAAKWSLPSRFHLVALTTLNSSHYADQHFLYHILLIPFTLFAAPPPNFRHRASLSPHYGVPWGLLDPPYASAERGGYNLLEWDSIRSFSSRGTRLFRTTMLIRNTAHHALTVKEAARCPRRI